MRPQRRCLTALSMLLVWTTREMCMEQAVQQRLRNTAPPRHARRFFAYVGAVVGLALLALVLVVLSGRSSLQAGQEVRPKLVSLANAAPEAK